MKKRNIPENQGFALIATITLMLLLALLSVGLLTIASTQTRLSQKSLFASEARAQARFALETAIGKLQVELGPDQRVSANSSIMGSENATEKNSVSSPNLLGVWDSWDTWLNRENSGGTNIASTYNKGRSQLFRGWMISSPYLQDIKRVDSPTSGDLGTSKGDVDRKVMLVGPGTLGQKRDRKDEVFAGLIQIDDGHDAEKNTVLPQNARHKKSMAWWISGENQKIRINLPKYLAGSSSSTIETLRKTWDTPTPDNDMIEGLSSLSKNLPAKNTEEYDRKVRLLISQGVLNLAAGASESDELKSLYHDVTLVSSGLPADVKFGGLKKDINTMISRAEVPDEFRNNSADAGLRPYSAEDGSPTVANRPISSWAQLYYWSNLWNPQGTKGGQDATAPLIWEGQTPRTLIASDAESASGMMNNHYTYVRQPIPLKYYSFVGIKLAATQGNVPEKTNAGFLAMSLGVIPVIVYWNPYNVEMKLEMPEGPWGTYVAQYRMMPMTISNNVVPFKPNIWSGTRAAVADDSIMNDPANKTDIGLIPYGVVMEGGNVDVEKNRTRQIADYGSTLRQTVTISASGAAEKGEMSVLKPGEIVIFSHPKLPPASWEQISRGEDAMSHLKAGHLDYTVDALPLKEGWSEDDEQTSFYACGGEVTKGAIRYDGLTGSEYNDTPKYKFDLNFAEKTDNLILTPDSVLIWKKLGGAGNNDGTLGNFVYMAGIVDTNKLGEMADHKDKTEGEGSDPEIYTKVSPMTFSMNWGAWEQPFIDKAYIPQEMWDNSPLAAFPDSLFVKSYADSREKVLRKGGYDNHDDLGYTDYGYNIVGRPKDLSLTFIAYFGVSNKWNTPPLIGAYPTDKDYRVKMWQHSSPHLWGSQMKTASELARTYSPYQFEIKFANDEFAPITLGNVLSNDGTRTSVFGGPGGMQLSKIVVSELPLHPPYSLAGFAGMRLTPGWYDSGVSKSDIAKRFAYQSGVPGVGIGNSFADPMLPADRIFSHNEISGDAEFGDFWDHGFMVNDGLWDSWFTSSISSRPTQFGSSQTESVREILSSVIPSDENNSKSGNEPHLSNSRFGIRLDGSSRDEVIRELSEEDGYNYVSKYIRIDGAFNVNSTSLTAWKALLSGLKDRQILFMNGNAPQTVDKREDEVCFSRFGIATSNQSHVDDLGSIGISSGLEDGELMAWTDLRKLNSSQMDELAEKLLIQVKKRGPFLNMAEFINRRLATGELGLKGALQSAIDESGCNREFDQLSGENVNPEASYPNAEAAKGSVYTAAPGYLIQSDILAVLGNVLTVRDDTFVVRAYGEITDKEGTQILARAWCEATVQRTTNYVDPSNSPETPVLKVNYSTGELEDAGLTATNKAFGRSFAITSFKWLTPEEI